MPILRPRLAKLNPGEVLLTALAQKDLESRLVEALPWVVLRYWEMDFAHIVELAKKFDLQNRLGFLVSLARKVSEANPQTEARTRALAGLESTLYRSRLGHENDFLRPARNHVEKQWLMQNRSEDSKHWNLVADLRPEPELPKPWRDFLAEIDMPRYRKRPSSYRG